MQPFALLDALCPVAGLTGWKFFARVLWISIQLLVAYALAREGSPFVYQAF